MTSKEVNLRLQNLKSIQDITNTYQQVAAIRMRKIKNTVVQNRNFYESLSGVYLETQRFYTKKEAPNTKYTSKRAQNSNGRSVSVLITANTGLYGSVVKDVFDLFVKETQNSTSDLVVAGRVGRNWIQALGASKPFKYFDLKDGADSIDADIKQVYDYVSKYANIDVYHGVFKNIVEQPARVTKVAQKIESKDEGEETLSFLFEPTIEKVLESFEEQLVYSLFDQAIYESALAKFGSRMMSLDTAAQNTSKAIATMQLSATKMKHRRQNRRQMELTSSMGLWQ